MRRIRKQRSQGASTLVDLVCAFVILVPLALFAVNIGYLALGAFVNDAACREAARVAAGQSSLSPAYNVASAVVQSFAIAGGAVSSPQVTAVNYNYSTDTNGDPVNITDLTSANLAQAPTVQVSTNLIAQTPAPMLFTSNGLSSQVILTSSYSFPIMTAIDTNPGGAATDSGNDNGQPPPSDGSGNPDQVDTGSGSSGSSGSSSGSSN